MHLYRTHNCSVLRLKDKNKTVKLSGWVHRKRDHGNLLFIDIRDHYGITQIVIDKNNKYFSIAEKTSSESVITITGKVVPNILLVSGLISFGPKLPMHPPKTLAQITKYLLVSIAFPGPTANVHHPSLLVIGLMFVTNWSPVKA